jgi:hypothetical protein
MGRLRPSRAGNKSNCDEFLQWNQQVPDGMKRMVAKTIGEKLTGSKAGMFRTVALSATVGVAAAIGTYKLLRSGN